MKRLDKLVKALDGRPDWLVALAIIVPAIVTIVTTLAVTYLLS